MEWDETTGRTVAEAKDTALDRLGVDEEDAEFEILEEPRLGLFGRLRAEARVRAALERLYQRQPACKVGAAAWMLCGADVAGSRVATAAGSGCGFSSCASAGSATVGAVGSR